MALKHKPWKSISEKWILRWLALLIACVLWIAVHGGKKLEITKRITLAYTVDNDKILVSQVPQHEH